VIAWTLFISGAVIAVVAGMFTLAPNGGCVMMMLWGFALIARQDVRDGL